MTDTKHSIDSLSSERLKLLEMYVDLYKHHLDWFLKAFIVYIAFSGTAAGIAFKSETSGFVRTLLVVLVAVISILGTASWIVGLTWVGGLEKKLRHTATEAHLEPISLSAAKAAIVSAILGSITVFVGSIVILVGRSK
jgi:hypothetical protein